MPEKKENKTIWLAASMLCADQAYLLRDIEKIGAAGVDLMHIDIMDGHFVPNMTGGLDVANCIRRFSKAPCDFHLMVQDPNYLIDALRLREGERLCFHIENAKNPLACIEKIRKTGAQAGIAMNPGTPVSSVAPYLPLLDYLLVLIVNPGFKGQPIIARTLEKLTMLRDMRDADGLKLRLFIDGAVTLDNMIEIVEAGADDLVCGPFTCFNEALGGIEPTLSKVKETLLLNGYKINCGSEGGELK